MIQSILSDEEENLSTLCMQTTIIGFKTVQSWPEKVNLLIKIKANGKKAKVPDETLAAHWDIFYIYEHVMNLIIVRNHYL